MLFLYTPAVAQTVLLPGDIQIITLNSGRTGTDLLALTDIQPGTELILSNGSWDPETNRVSNGDTLNIRFDRQLKAGNHIRIDSTMSSLPDTERFPEFDSSGRLFLYQREDTLDRVLFVAHIFGSELLLPSGINAENQLILPDSGLNHQYHLVNGASGTLQMLKAMVSDPENWRMSATPFPAFQTSFRLLKAPVLQFTDPFSTVYEGDTLYLSVSIFEHDGSRLNVEAVFSDEQSTADTLTLNGLNKHTFNFTGLIGSADYLIPVPIRDNDHFSGTETATFQLENHSSGTLGDFVHHTVFIRDNDVPEVVPVQQSRAVDEEHPVSPSDLESVAVTLEDSTNHAADSVMHAKFRSGWYLVSAAGNDSVLSWKESTQELAIQPASDAGTARFAYLSAPLSQPDSSLKKEDSVTWVPAVFRVSATDADENGIINDAEGFNLLVNSSKNDIVLRTLIQTLEQQTGKNTWYPYAFLYPDERLDGGELRTLTADDVIPPQSAFWLRADSVIDEQMITLIADNMSASEAGQPVPAEDVIKLMISSGTDSAYATLVHMEDQESDQRDVADPLLSTGWFDSREPFVRIGIRAGNVFNSSVYIPEDTESTMIYPLDIAGNVRSELTLTIDLLSGINEDWSVSLFDRKDNQEWKMEPLSPFTITIPETVSDSTVWIRGRFELRIYPPDMSGESSDKPDIISLGQNYPNPFNPRTTISIFLPDTERIRVSIFNVVGQPVAELVNGTLPGGEHTFDWDATGLPSGMYIYQLETETQVLTKKMTLVK